MGRSFSFVVLLAVVAAEPKLKLRPTTGFQPAASRRVILLSFDGAGDWMVDRFVAEGRAPAFARMAAKGASADAMISTIPTLTAVAHATLWTGADPRRHGIFGNWVTPLPIAEHTVLETQSGFENHTLTAEPIWITAARAGKRVLVPQATQGYPFSRAHTDRLLQFDVYANRLIEPAIIEGRRGEARTVVGRSFSFGLGDSTFEVRRDADSAVRIVGGGEEVVIRAGLGSSFSPPMTVRVRERQARVRFRLLSLDSKTGAFRLFHGAAMQIVSSDPARLPDFEKQVGAIVGETVSNDYAAERFGPTLASNGTGDAEAWLADMALANHRYFEGMAAFAATEPWDLLVLYVSSFDLVAHALTGMVDADASTFAAARAEMVWPRLTDLFVRLVDAFLGDVRARFPDSTVVVVSDHGHAGIGRRVLPNVALRRAGLLALDARGRIDLTKTKALLPPARGHQPFIVINTTKWKGGIVRPEDRDAVARAASAALLGIRDPVTGRAPIRAVLDLHTDGEALGIGHDGVGDLLFDPDVDYFPDARLQGPDIVSRTRPTGLGVHGMFPTRRTMHAIFYAAGPGISAGRRLGLVRSIDIAPTVAALLGIPPPADATGRSLPVR